jgi:hypothetical protein
MWKLVVVLMLTALLCAHAEEEQAKNGKKTREPRLIVNDSE